MPVGHADMIYIDGPNLVGESCFITNIDRFLFLPKVIVIDERIMQTDYIKLMYKNYYDILEEDDVTIFTLKKRKEQ